MEAIDQIEHHVLQIRDKLDAATKKLEQMKRLSVSLSLKLENRMVFAFENEEC